MSDIVVGIGDMAVSNKKGDIIKTFALGSCVAVIMYARKIQVAGMVHIALHDSKINPEKAISHPGYFANTGVPLLFQKMTRLGCSLNGRDMIVKLAGGARVMDPNSYFDIGNRNILAIKDILHNLRMGIFSADIGGTKSRTVSVSVKTGEVTLSSQNSEVWMI